MNKLFFLSFLVLLFSCQTKQTTENQNISENAAASDEATASTQNTENQGAEIKPNNPKTAQSGHEQNISAFPELKTISPAGSANVFLFFDPEHTQILNEKDTARDAEPTVLVLKTKLDNKEKDIYSIIFSPGLSNDPLFTVKKGKKEIGSFSANELIIPGNGSVYTTGRTNNLFDQRRKFQLKDGKITEVKQPFLYVGLQTKTKVPVQLYTSTDFKQVLTSLPKNTEIEVLISNGKNYLIRTPFGLTGWWKNTSGKDNPIEGLKFEGD